MCELATRILQRISLRGRPRPCAVLIDGRSGSGKTTLGRELAQRLSAQLVSMDELYPGWGGLSVGSAAVTEMLRTSRYSRYDWEAAKFGESVSLDPDRAIVIEGCGSLTTQNRESATVWAGTPTRTLALWLESPTELRYHRAIARDGDLFRPYWQQWATQEDAHFSEELPWALADEIVQSR